MLEKLILIGGVIATASIGVFVITRDPLKRTNQLYTIMTTAMVVLMIANSMTQPDGADPLLNIRIVLAATTITITSLYLLVRNLSGPYRKKFSVADKLIILLTIVIAALDVSPFVFRDITSSMGGIVPTASWGAPLFLLHFILLLAASVVILLKRVRRRGTKEKGQYVSIILAIAPVLILAPITSFILPVIYQNSALTVLTPIYLVYFVSMIAYAMVRHGLFDIKRAAVRTSVYVLVLATLAALYYGILFLASKTVFSNTPLSSTEVSPLNLGVALVLAFIFQPVKSFFDRVTNRIFFRDRYDSEEFFALLSNVLGTTTNLKGLLIEASDIIAMTLKSKQVFFFIQSQQTGHIVAGTSRHSQINSEEARYLESLVQKTHGGILVTDNLRSERHAYGVLRKHDIALLLPLWLQGRIIGCLALGEALGVRYANRDFKVLEAIADELVIAIQNALSLEQVRETNANLQERVDHATHDLRLKNERLKQLDDTKDEFISMASHQLRTPLTSVKGYVSMILDGDAGPITDQQRAFLTEAFESSNRMAGIIGDFLNVSRLQTGKFNVEREVVDLAELVDSEVQHLENTARARGLKLQYHRPAHFPAMNLDKSKIEQVVMNFIDNALFYAPNTGSVEVELFQRAGRAVFTVRDHGIGVPKSEQNSLFTKFFRATNARRKRPDGTGVGLFLAKKVIVAHKGAIIFDSTEGKGSTFGFEIPIK